MSKKIKISIIVIVSIIALLVVGFFVAREIVVDYVFDKVYNEVVEEMIENEKTDIKQQEVFEKPTIVGEDGAEYQMPDENDTEETTIEIVGQDGEKHTVKKPAVEEKPKSSTDVAIKRISELTPQELKEIQALVTSADKMAVLGIVKSALTADDKREIKAMIESGKIDYGRCRQIASQRLSPEQKKQIYGYYEKYAKIYFASK